MNVWRVWGTLVWGMMGVHAALASATAEAEEIVWQQSYDVFQDRFGPSQFAPAAPQQLNKELADDFDLLGTVSRVDVTGVNSFFGAGSAPFYGLYVRFYAFGPDGKPGALLAQYYLPRNDPRLWVDFPDYPMSFHATLEPSFQATGRHFVAMQTRMDVRDGSYWEWNGANKGRPRGESLYFRDLNAPDPSWAHVGTSSSDLDLTLWGTRQPQPPAIYTLSSATLPRSGRVKINGVRFGNQEGNGYVSIDGRQAPVTRWSDWQITAYVPEAAALVSVMVQVVNDLGASNELSLTVTLRPPPQSHLDWRFMADSYYILHRPVIGSDRTIYTVDTEGVLYALSPRGGLKWLLKYDGLGYYGPPTIGPDDTVYVPGLYHTITAVNPDGSVRWRFTENPSGQGVMAGPTVGPDGNIYVVTDLGGLGAFALSPQGQVLWNVPGFIFYGTIGRELVFAPQGQFYFQENPGAGNIPSRLHAIGLDGQPRWQYNMHLGGSGPAAGPDGTAYVSWYSASTSRHLEAINPDGSLRWTLFRSTLGNISGMDVAIDGLLYVVGNFNYLHAIRPNGTVRWQYFEDVMLGSPVVSPLNDVVLMGGVEGTGGNRPTFIRAVSTAGQPLWRDDLPFENGTYIVPMAPARFTPDGRRAYVGTSGNNYAEDIYCYLYAVRISDMPGTLPGDLDGDGDVDLSDFVTFQLCFGGSNNPPAPSCPAGADADLDGDGDVDLADFLIFQQNFTGSL